MNPSSAIVPGRVYGVAAVVGRNLRVWRRFFASSMVGNVAEPILYLLAMGYGLGGFIPQVDGMTYVQFIAPGLIISATMYNATFEGTYGTFTRLVPQRTFEGIIATPIGISELVVGEIFYASLKALASGCAVLLVLTAFGLVESPAALLVVPISFLAGLFFSGAAVVVTGMSPSYDFFNYYFTLVITPMFLFSGIFFPLHELPSWVQTVSWFNPLAHATDAARALFVERFDMHLATDTLWLLVAALLPLAPAASLIRRRLIQ
jgi:lipooligosaccharide transport system permease protein